VQRFTVRLPIRQRQRARDAFLRLTQLTQDTQTQRPSRLESRYGALVKSGRLERRFDQCQHSGVVTLLARDVGELCLQFTSPLLRVVQLASRFIGDLRIRET
jgi:hypothetical protein